MHYPRCRTCHFIPFIVNIKYKKTFTSYLLQDMPLLTADEKTRMLISLVEDIHHCAEIMQNRTLRY